MWLVAWRVAVQLFYIAIVLAVFSALRERMEFIVVALFGELYAIVRAGFIYNSMMMLGLADRLETELDTIKAAVIPGYSSDHEMRKEKRKNPERVIQRMNIEIGGLAVVNLICLYQIFTALTA